MTTGIARASSLTKGRALRAAGFALAATALLAGCSQRLEATQGIVKEQLQFSDDLAPLIRDELGYVPLKLPTTAFAPGAIIELTQGPDGSSKVSFYSHMETCGATADDLETRVANTPSVNIDRNFEAGATLNLAFGGATFAPNAGYVNGAVVKIDSLSANALDQIKVDSWRDRLLAADIGEVPAKCLEIIQNTPKKLFIVREALAINGGTVTYTAKAGAEANLENALLSEASKVVSAGAKVSLVNNRTMRFESPIIVGVKRLQYVSGEELRLSGNITLLPKEQLGKVDVMMVLGRELDNE